MKKKTTIIILAACLVLININFVTAQNTEKTYEKNENTEENLSYDFSDEYGIQWEMNFGSDNSYGARYEGPQPIGDCDNDGQNELLVGGRDSSLRIFEWDNSKQTYLEMHTLHCPGYPLVDMDADGFGIGDLTGDGENEIAVSWYATIHKWSDGRYTTLGVSKWLEDNGGGSPDCLIGDCDNDGQNELILSCRFWGRSVPEIVVFGWNGLSLVKEAEWDDPGVDGAVFMAGIGDIDEDDENEIVCGSANKVVVLDWDKQNNEFKSTILKTTDGWENYPFACVCKDSDMDGKNEIHVGYYSPDITIFEWNGQGYEIKYEKHWPGEGVLIESLDVGDVDDDGKPEVCAGTNLVHILQWDGSTYVEEAVLPTFGELAVLNIGDCDNDGKNEIHAGSVIIDHDQDFMSWVYKYGLEPNYDLYDKQNLNTYGTLKVKVEQTGLGKGLGGASVAAWNLDTKTWYDIQPEQFIRGKYVRYYLPPGEYLLRVSIENYESQETTITVNDDEITSYTFSLKSKSKNIIPVQRFLNPLFLQILKKFFDSHPLLQDLFKLFILNELRDI